MGCYLRPGYIGTRFLSPFVFWCRLSNTTQALQRVKWGLFLLCFIIFFSISNTQAYSPNNLPAGECTWYAYEKWPQIYQPPPSTRHAYYWIGDARDKGYKTGTTPEVGAIAVWDQGVGGAPAAYGHVAYVKTVATPAPSNRLTTNMKYRKQIVC